MAIKKQKPNATGLATSLERVTSQPAAETGIASTFRKPGPAKRKTTLEFDADVFYALKLQALQSDESVRTIVDRYCRAGLEADGHDLPHP